MKKLLRKATSVLCVLALVLSYVGVVSFAEAKEGNLALDGEMIADSEQAPGDDGKTFYAANANDGDWTTRWQSNATGNGEGNEAWIGCTWTEEQEVNVIVIDWETAHPSTEGFYVETSEDRETWTPVKFTNVRTGTKANDHQVDTITLKETANTKNIRVVCFEAYVIPEGLENAGNTKENPSAYEFKVYAVAPTVEPNIAVSAFVDVSSSDGTHEKLNLTDGAKGSFWQANSTENEWFSLTWEKEQNISKLLLFWGTSYPNREDITVQISDGNDDWTPVSATIVRTDDHNDEVTLTDVTTDAIRIDIAKSSGKEAVQCLEVEVNGTPVPDVDNFAATTQFVSSVAISGKDGLVDRLVVTNVGDGSFDKDDVVQINYTITRGDDERTGSAILTEAWTAIAMDLDGEPTEFTAKSLGGSKGQYVTGMIFYDLLPDDVIKVELTKVDAPAEE